MSRATYAELGDACATAHGMELIGSRWSYPILRELMLGPKRFSELLVTVRGISPAVLTARLRQMTSAGLIEAAPPGEGTPPMYGLTEWATRLGPILRDVGRWAQESPTQQDAGGLTPDAAVQAMITMARRNPDRELGRLELHLSDYRVRADIDHTYRIRWDRRGLTATRGTDPKAAAMLHCDSTSWGRVLFTGLPLRNSGAEITGDPATVVSLLSCFQAAVPLPSATAIP